LVSGSVLDFSCMYQRRLDRVVCTKDQIVELVKESLLI